MSACIIRVQLCNRSVWCAKLALIVPTRHEGLSSLIELGLAAKGRNREVIDAAHEWYNRQCKDYFLVTAKSFAAGNLGVAPNRVAGSC